MAESTRSSKKTAGHLLLQALTVAVLAGILIVFAILLTILRDIRRIAESIQTYGLKVDADSTFDVRLIDTSGDLFGNQYNPFYVS